MDGQEKAVTEISIQQGEKDYLLRIKRIIQCLAKSVGMDLKQVDETTNAIVEAYDNAIKEGIISGGSEAFNLRFQSDGKQLTAEIAGEKETNLLTLCQKSVGSQDDEEVDLGIRTFAETVQDHSKGYGTVVSLTKVLDKHTDI